MGADGLASDIERLIQVNRLLENVPQPSRSQLPWRPVDLMLIEPSRRLESLVVETTGELPRSIRLLMSRLGGSGIGASLLASYVLFESAYLEKLIDLGYQDALERSDEIVRFLFQGVD